MTTHNHIISVIFFDIGNSRSSCAQKLKKGFPERFCTVFSTTKCHVRRNKGFVVRQQSPFRRVFKPSQRCKQAILAAQTSLVCTRHYLWKSLLPCLINSTTHYISTFYTNANNLSREYQNSAPMISAHVVLAFSADNNTQFFFIDVR